MKEESEVKEMRDSFERSDTSFSSASCKYFKTRFSGRSLFIHSELFKQMRMRILAGGIILIALYGSALSYSIIETHTNPINGKKKILPTNKETGK